MKKLYKTFLVLLSVMLIATLSTGCSNKTDDDNLSNSALSETFNIAVAVDFAPFGYKTEDGNFCGIDVDIINEIIKQNNLDVTVNYMTTAEALYALEMGTADGILSHLGISETRLQKYDFSDPYYVSGLITAKKVVNVLNSLEELKGGKVAVTENSLGSFYAQSISETYGFTTIPYKNVAEMYDAVLNDTVDACIGSYAEIGHAIKNGAALSMVGDKIIGTSYGFAVMKGQNSALLDSFNAGLAAIKQSGLYQTIINTYIAG